jgi:phosphoribosylamine--glycine ligase
MDVTRTLVIGSGGREHALAWRLARDPERPEVLVAPGNDGMAEAFERLPIAADDAAGLADACRARRVSRAVIGPEAPLAAGLADALAAAGVAVFGPSAAAARLESSKWFAKQVMREARVPTARAAVFDSRPEAVAALSGFGPPWVVKADGLAAGKGVLVTSVRAEAEGFVAACLERARFGAGGRRVLLEEFLDGEEASVMAVCDGERFVLLPAARDYKRARDGDAGPNTGGMGAFAPTAAVDAATEARVGREIVAPVLDAMRARGAPFRGLLYAGLMLTRSGPRVVEFNVRFGDPETQVVVPLVDGSLGALLASAARGALEPDCIARRPGAAVAVALVDEAYPEAARGEGVIAGLDGLAAMEDVTVFHAGAVRDATSWRVRGGRAAYVMARGAGREDARTRAYRAIASLSGSGWRARGDIGSPPAVASRAGGNA